MKQKTWVRWLAVFIWMVVIYAFSHQPYSGRESEKYLHDMNVPVRKAGHVGEYLILFLLIRWALEKPKSAATASATIDGGSSAKAKKVVSPATIAFILTISYAATDEWHQSYIPGRSSSWHDVAVDACGATLGLIALASYHRFKKN